MRLLSPNEIVDKLDEIAGWGSNLRHSCPLYIGWNCELACVYANGPLAGRVYFIDDDGVSGSVVFRSIPSFLASMKLYSASPQGQEDFTDYAAIIPDYFWQYNSLDPLTTPLPRRATEPDRRSDFFAWKQLWSEFQDSGVSDADYKDDGTDQEFSWYVLNLIGLADEGQSETIHRFVGSACAPADERAREWIEWQRFIQHE